MNFKTPCYGFIPARFASSRFPGKPLADILGKPMFWHVHSRAARCPEFHKVVVATDDARIEKAARELDVPVVMTSADHASGTDRIREAAERYGLPDNAVVANIQGDEPALNPQMLSELVAPFFTDPEVEATTLAHMIDVHEAARPDRVKVAVSPIGDALYFSRAPIPYSAQPDASFWGHIGLYAFRMKTLRAITELPPSPLEQREKLEQLRLLENGLKIRVVPTKFSSRGVDRPEDIPHIIEMMQKETHSCEQ